MGECSFQSLEPGVVCVCVYILLFYLWTEVLYLNAWNIHYCNCTGSATISVIWMETEMPELMAWKIILTFIRGKLRGYCKQKYIKKSQGHILMSY